MKRMSYKVGTRYRVNSSCQLGSSWMAKGEEFTIAKSTGMTKAICLIEGDADEDYPNGGWTSMAPKSWIRENCTQIDSKPANTYLLPQFIDLL